MIKQSAVGLDSRSEASPRINRMLPLITAPMTCVADSENWKVFHDAGINVCVSRGVIDTIDYTHTPQENLFYAISLDRFIDDYITNGLNTPYRVCVDVANGNMRKLHDAIRQAKLIHGDSIEIMAGNVSSVAAFLELAKTGVDYIRVGVGGGSSCNTTRNTAVGQEDLGELVRACYQAKYDIITMRPRHTNLFIQECRWNQIWEADGEDIEVVLTNPQVEIEAIKNVKIVADGISSYIKLCSKKWDYADNGYAAINQLLYNGADLVMIGTLFAQCIESAGGKEVYDSVNRWHGILGYTDSVLPSFLPNHMRVKISGMSTQLEQKNYKDENSLRHSEGSVRWEKVRWTLSDWISGNISQDTYPFLSGFENCLKSAMSYTGARTLDKFKINLQPV